MDDLQELERATLPVEIQESATLLSPHEPHAVSDAQLKSVECDAKGPLAWVKKLQLGYEAVFEELGRQLEDITVHTCCSGTGSATLAVKAP